MGINLVKDYKEKKKQIEVCFAENDLEKIKIFLDGFPIKNAFYFIAKANYLYLTGDVFKSKEVLEDIFEKFPNSYDIHYNLALMFDATEEYEKAILTFARAFKVAGNQEDRELALNHLNQLLNKISKNTNLNIESISKEAQSIIEETDDRWYPINRKGKSVVREVILNNEGEEYFTNLYRVMGNVNNVDNISRYFTKTELIPGHLNKKIDFKISGKSIIPVSFKEEMVNVKVKAPNKDYDFDSNSLALNRFNYLVFDEPGKYTVEGSKDIFVGNPWPLKTEKSKKPLIINLFIDGFAYTEIKDRIKELMPNTYNFFNNGYISQATYTTGEWTYPSMSSMLTGKTSLKHGRYHGTNLYNFTKFNNIFFQDFKRAGYMTSHITGNWRMTPTFGYLEGVDRTLFQNSVGGFHVGEIVSEIIEQIETFKDSNQFIWAGIMDLHDVPDEVHNDLYSQSLVQADTRQKSNIASTSVLSKYDVNKILRYEAEIRRIDLHLANLYDYIQRNYKYEDYLISIVSDHGQGFLSKEEFLLNEPRRNVVFMMTGGGVPSILDNKVNSIIDIVPTIASIAGVDLNPCEGKVIAAISGKERDFAITETIHPNQPYRVAITDSKYIFRFETQDNLDENCHIDLEFFDAKLLDKYTMEIVEDKGILEKYTQYVIERAMILQR